MSRIQFVCLLVLLCASCGRRGSRKPAAQSASAQIKREAMRKPGIEVADGSRKEFDIACGSKGASQEHARLRLSGRKEALRLDDGKQTKIRVPVLHELPEPLAVELQLMVKRFILMRQSEYASHADKESIDKRPALGGQCRVWSTGAVVSTVCELTTDYHEPRSHFVTYRTSNFLLCEKGWRRLHFRRDMCGNDKQCVDRVLRAIGGVLKGEFEPAEFAFMMDHYPDSLDLFTVSDHYLTFWFGEQALTHPRRWSSSSDDGLNTLRVEYDRLGAIHQGVLAQLSRVKK